MSLFLLLLLYPQPTEWNWNTICAYVNVWSQCLARLAQKHTHTHTKHATPLQQTHTHLFTFLHSCHDDSFQTCFID